MQKRTDLVLWASHNLRLLRAADRGFAGTDERLIKQVDERAGVEDFQVGWLSFWGNREQVDEVWTAHAEWDAHFWNDVQDKLSSNIQECVAEMAAAAVRTTDVELTDSELWALAARPRLRRRLLDAAGHPYDRRPNDKAVNCSSRFLDRLFAAALDIDSSPFSLRDLRDIHDWRSNDPQEKLLLGDIAHRLWESGRKHLPTGDPFDWMCLYAQLRPQYAGTTNNPTKRIPRCITTVASLANKGTIDADTADHLVHRMSEAHCAEQLLSLQVSLLRLLRTGQDSVIDELLYKEREA